MWTTANRPKYNPDTHRFPSDLTAAEWAHIEPRIPPAKHGGRKRKVDVREVANGIMYVLSTGCQWRYVPKDLPQDLAQDLPPPPAIPPQSLGKRLLRHLASPS